MLTHTRAVAIVEMAPIKRIGTRMGPKRTIFSLARVDKGWRTKGLKGGKTGSLWIMLLGVVMVLLLLMVVVL